jgi:hypothetical protein
LDQKVRIFVNRQPVKGPWGGGSKVLRAIIDEANKRGHIVSHDIRQVCDLIFCVDPRPDKDVNFGSLLEMKKRDKCLLIQRVGDLGFHGKPELFNLVVETIQYADHVIFPSHWAKMQSRVDSSNSCVIQNAPIKQFIKPIKERNKFDDFRIVSHHWSDNFMKGFDTYKILDDFCQKNDNYTFTFIGRKPDYIDLKNHIPPQDIDGLLKHLPENNIYVTASKKEAGANHVLEAIGLGLPVFYHADGGSINEYCEKYGCQYKDDDDLLTILSDTVAIKKLIEKMPHYTRNSEDMAADYLDLFEVLYESKH